MITISFSHHFVHKIAEIEYAGFDHLLHMLEAIDISNLGSILTYTVRCVNINALSVKTCKAFIVLRIMHVHSALLFGNVSTKILQYISLQIRQCS